MAFKQMQNDVQDTKARRVASFGYLSAGRFYDRWAGDIALTTLSGRQVATDILLATYG